jgi:type I restriction enzyme S subunit
MHPDQIVADSASPLLGVAPWWGRVRLGDVVEVVNGAAFPSELFNSDRRGERLVRIRDVGQNSPEVYYDGPYEEHHVIDNGDLLIGMDGDFRVALWGGSRALLNQRVCRLQVPDPDLYSNRLLLHVLQPYLNAVHAVTSSVTVKHLSSRTIQDLPIPLPPRAEQNRIVAALEEHVSRLDAAEQALTSARTRLAGFRSSTTSETLNGDWPVVRLGDHTVDQRYGSSAKASREGKVPILRMGNIVDGHLDFADLKYLPDGHPDIETCTLAVGDLLFNRTNSPELVGKSAVFEGRGTPVTFASYLIRVRLDEELDPHWAATAINSPAGRRYIDAVRTQQVGQANVNGTKLRDFPVPTPSIDVQRERLTQLDQARAWLTAVESEINRALTRASALRRSILASALSGQLVPQDPDDQPASVLLQRIRDQRAAPDPTRQARVQGASRSRDRSHPARPARMNPPGRRRQP